MVGFTIYQLLIIFIFWIPLTILFLRIALPIVRAPFSDPLVGWVYKSTNPVLRPLERFVPRWRNLSLAAVLVFWLVAAIEFALLSLRVSPAAWAVGGLAGAIGFALGWLIALTLLHVLFSLFQPREGTSLVHMTARIVVPMVSPLRRRLPLLGPFDLSPAVLMLGLMLLRLVLVGALYGVAAKL